MVVESNEGWAFRGSWSTRNIYWAREECFCQGREDEGVQYEGRDQGRGAFDQRWDLGSGKKGVERFKVVDNFSLTSQYLSVPQFQQKFQWMIELLLLWGVNCESLTSPSRDPLIFTSPWPFGPDSNFSVSHSSLFLLPLFLPSPIKHRNVDCAYSDRAAFGWHGPKQLWIRTGHSFVSKFKMQEFEGV